jgi:hypothetical protein
VAPDAAGDAGVHVADAVGREACGARLVVGELGVPAVDDQVTGGQQLAELVDRRLGDGSGRDHGPDDPRSGQLLDHLGEARGIGDVRVAVVPDDLVACFADPFPHVAAHPAETDKTELHGVPLSGVVPGPKYQRVTRIGMIR